MSSEYILRIDTEREKYDSLSSLLGVVPTSTKSYWEYSIYEQSDLYPQALAHFLDLLQGGIKKIDTMGIRRDALSLWYLYEYEEQCNIEFSPYQLKGLGELGVVLCISCWQKQLSFFMV